MLTCKVQFYRYKKPNTVFKNSNYKSYQ